MPVRVLVEITCDMNDHNPTTAKSRSSGNKTKSNKLQKVKSEPKRNILPRNGVDVISNRKLMEISKENKPEKIQKSEKESKAPANSINDSCDKKTSEKAEQFVITIDVGDEDDEKQIGFLKMSPKVSAESAAIREPILPIKSELPRPKIKPIKPASKTKNITEIKLNSKKSKTVQSHHITEYYPIRRSSRKTKSEVKKEIEEDMIDAVLNDREDGLDVVDFKDKGRGIVASRLFKKSTFIVEYAGDLISWQDAKIREAEYSKDPNIGCYMYYFNTDSINYCIDATSESGRKGRLLNHSRKNPNCKTKLVKIPNEDGTLLPKLVLIAARDIQCGEELTYDYGDRDKSSLDVHPWLKC